MSGPLLSFRPRPEIAEAIKALAAEDRRPVSRYLEILVEDALAKRQGEQRRSA